MPSAEGPKWSFYIELDAVYTHQYVKASICKWHAQKKQPRTAARVHIGRLCDDNSIRPGKTFLEKFPKYQGKELYYYENKLLDREGYLKSNPEAQQQWNELEKDAAKPKKTMQDLLEEDWRAISRQCGPTYSAWMHMKQSKMIDDLEAAFGTQDARVLAALAVYAMCQPGAAMENFTSWLGGVYLASVEPISGQRTSELLGRVTRAKVDQFFTARFNQLLKVARQTREEKAKTDHEAINELLTIAFDSTSISTYSSTIEDTEYSKAKDNPELKQVNLTLACDQKTGEVPYAREYAGSINDVASFLEIFKDMKNVGFHVEDIELVTDRGYKSAYNIQAQLDAGVKFVQGLRIDEDSIKAKNANRKVSSDDWSCYGKCIGTVTEQSGEVKYVRNMQEINQRLQYAGCFAIRTNYRHDPVEALRVYRQRAKVAAQYRTFKNEIEGDRMRASQLAYVGKLFIFTLATSVRCKLGTTLRLTAQESNCKVPNNSLDTVLMELAKVTLPRRGDQLCRRPDMLTKKQRDYFALLDVIPPKRLFQN